MTVVVLAALVVASLALIYHRHGIDGVKQGIGQSWTMIRRIAPMMLIGLVIAGMAQVALPDELISRWLGDEAGFQGLLIGVAVGAIVPAGPYVVLPLLGSLLASGAGVGPIVAFMTAWSVIPISRTLVWEAPFLGPAFALSRIIVALPFPFIAGWMAPPVFRFVS